MYKLIILLLTSCFCCLSTTKAQFVELGGFGGALSFNGDVNEGDILSNTNAAFGGFFRYNPHPHLAVTLSFIKGTLEAKDRSSKHNNIRERNLSFKSDLMEFSLIPEFNILPFYPKKSKQILAPYIGIGIGVIVFNPTTKYEGEWVALQAIGTEGQGLEGYPSKYSLVEFAVPVLLGLKYSIGGRLNIALEIGYRFTTTDYLDDVSTIYLPKKTLMNSSQLAVALSNRTEEYTGVVADHLTGTRRGNSNNKDSYLTFGIRISFGLYGKKAYKRKKMQYKINKWF
ncbi:DUF6089 family protein [Aureispira sp. CCB-E]|uniref:type IX secretion system protein PorG n=1 Tax=Aureispira sp. CCB-E TaxID=3051121 RepID=UPI00286874C9|nr:DUF6089 family protein [Aureispira sp. CCB-E]WMX13020.1 DUF6089 family protein [Aureispira sp. CCB-E]